MIERKTIEWYEDYQVSNTWLIKSFKNWEKIMKPIIDRYWYYQIKLYWYESKILLIHRLVWFAFLEYKEWTEINHKNWIKSDNRVDNLEWITRSKNLEHRYRVLLQKWNFQINNPTKWKFWKDNHLSIKINQFTKDWKFIKLWYSMMDIEKELWLERWNICACCKWLKHRKTLWWYIRKYALDNK